MDDMRDLVAGFMEEARLINERVGRINKSSQAFNLVSSHYDFLMKCVANDEFTVSVTITRHNEAGAREETVITVGSGEKNFRDKIFNRLVALTKHRINWHRGQMINLAKGLIE